MRLYETSSTVKQNDACIPQQYAQVSRTMKMMRVMSVVFLVLGVGLCAVSWKQSIPAAILCLVMFGFVATIMIPVGKASARRVAANLHPGGEGTWQAITWFENDGIHSADEDGEDDVYPLSTLVCAYRADNVLLLCTKGQSVLPINLVQLSETDRKSVIERLKTECPSLKLIQTK